MFTAIEEKSTVLTNALITLWKDPYNSETFIALFRFLHGCYLMAEHDSDIEKEFRFLIAIHFEKRQLLAMKEINKRKI